MVDVDDYLGELQHPRKAEVQQIRSAILASDPLLSESIKWNAPTFIFDGEDRVTFRLHPGDRVELVLHRGARKRADATSFAFDDASALVQWAAPDRGVIAIPEGADLSELTPTIIRVIHAWVRA